MRQCNLDGNVEEKHTAVPGEGDFHECTLAGHCEALEMPQRYSKRPLQRKKGESRPVVDE